MKTGDTVLHLDAGAKRQRFTVVAVGVDFLTLRASNGDEILAKRSDVQKDDRVRSDPFNETPPRRGKGFRKKKSIEPVFVPQGGQAEYRRGGRRRP